MNLLKLGKSISSSLQQLRKDELGQVLPMMALMLIPLLGMAALAVDAGRAEYAHRELQAETDAAALAGAAGLPNGTTAISNANAYSSVAGDKNTGANLQGVSMVTGYPALQCLTTLKNEGIACAAPGNANAIQVKQQLTMPMYFAGLFGYHSVTIVASSTAAMNGSTTSPYNVAVIVDTTGSMSDNDSDSNCASTRLSCEMAGVQMLLKTLSPCGAGLTSCGTATLGNVTNSVDRVSLLTFPAVSSTTVSADYDCSGSTNPTIAKYNTPVPQVASELPAGSTYQILPFTSDYRTSDLATTLNPSSQLVEAVDGNSGCSGMQNPGGTGTYYAGVIYAAGNYLLAEQTANPGSKNVLIILSDGDSNATYANMGSNTSQTSGVFPSSIKQCGQAVTAAKYVATQGVGGTRVYSVAYGAESTGCSTDAGAYTPCTTMQNIASAPQYFFSDYTATGSGGCVSASQPTTNLNQIFTQIVANLTSPRLIPDGTP